jgi:chromate transporter
MTPPSCTTEPLTKPRLLELALTFNKISLVSFGGGLSAWARRVIVEEKKWLDDEEFLSALTLSRVLPGANQMNFAVYVGNRFHGFEGAIAAVLGLITIPFLIILALAYAYFLHSTTPAVQDVLHGVTTVAIGLALSMGLKMGEKFVFNPSAMLFGALAFAASVFLKLPLIAVLAMLGPPAFLVAWRHHPRKNTSHEARSNSIAD